jgi:hypothetical protein
MKQEIYNYVNTLMTAEYPQLTGKVFWANTRLEEPKKAYLMMTVINDDEIHRTSEINGVVTEYRSATVTFRICLDSEFFTNDDLCQEMIDYLRTNLSSENAVDYFQALKMSNRWESISSTRDMTRPVDGGYIYIREFDIPFEYMANLEQSGIKVSKGVKADVSANGEVDIDFLLTQPDETDTI